MRSERHGQTAVLILVACITLVTALAVLGAFYYPGDIGAEQPIPFSHRVHAGDKQIGCLLCHPGAFTTAVAGLPPVETCMLCHSRIIIHYPQIERVRRHYEQGEPIWWVRVSNLPDLTHFDHSMHLISGVDCGRCHGDIKAMDRIVLPQKFDMGFCIQCHRENNATHDCFACHY
ncbi:MAG: cytochrome C [Planctomycetes bacterium RBG_13_60_9]|nr:MAG: cytochrome C [Planctomycetes bacterium RBG_13_60_9]